MSTNVISNTSDGYQSSGVVPVGLGWDTCHDATGHSNPTTTSTNSSIFGPRVQFSTFRGGIFFINRCFFDFNLSLVSTGVTAVNFKTVTDTNGGHDAIVLKSGHDPSNTSTKWFSTWLTGLSGTLSGWSNSDSQVQPYTNNVTMAGSAGTTTFPFNSQGVTDVNSLAGTSTAFKIVLMNYDFDYLDVDPQPSAGSQITGLNFANHGTVGKRPFLEITVGTASGYGHKVINVPASDISKVIGVATADIDKVIGVD